ncbi:MAG: biosynthetic-type acetolactate synthase large subunit [Bacillota bacterium]|jgi:acetolactate synthase-1/2/3 large subunit
MTITGAQALLKSIEKQGVDLVFGYPGGAVLSIYDALIDSSIKHILTRTEQGAAHAASGYARISGKVGVCIATSGPGSTNLVTGIATAYMDSIPIVAITGQVAKKMIGTDAFQEVDITGITHPITKHNYLITEANDIPRVIAEAFYIAATGRPGPVLIDIPKDVTDAVCEAKVEHEVCLPGYKPTYRGHISQIKSACHAMDNSQRPLIYAGGGVISSRSWDQVQQLAEKISAPVVTSLMGKGTMRANHPLYLGMMGMHGLPSANLAASNTDLLIAIGARFGDRITGLTEKFAQAAKIIHIDIDPAEIGKNIPSNIPIVGDVKMVLEEILSRVQPAQHQEWLEKIETFKDRNIAIQKSNHNYLTSWHVLTRLGELVSDKAIITTDVGQHQMSAAQFYDAKRAGAFLTSGGLGTMGYGLPAALGAQLAAPDDLVICLSGDGSLQMSLNEMATIKAHNLPVKIILFNNCCLGLVRQLQHIYCKDNFFAVDMPGNPDFLRLADAYGFEAYRVESPYDVDATLQKMLHNDKPTLIECKIRKEDLVLPMVMTGKGLDEMMMP